LAGYFCSLWNSINYQTLLYLSFLKGFKRASIDVPVPKWQTIKDEYYTTGLRLKAIKH